MISAQNEKKTAQYTAHCTKINQYVPGSKNPFFHEIEEIKAWLIATGRPPEDYLFRLIIDKCENDPEARQHFLRYSRTQKARNLVPVPNADSRTQKTRNSGINDDIEQIRQWLVSIGEPEEQHNLVLDKCRSDPAALAYFLKHAGGEFNNL